MELRAAATMYAVPERRTFKQDDGTERSPYITSLLVGGDRLKFYSDEDPTKGLNGSLARVQRGEMVPVTAVLRVYEGRNSKPGLALDRIEEPSPAGSK